MGIFRGKIKDIKNWWQQEGIKLKEDEEVTIIIGKKPPSSGNKKSKDDKDKSTNKNKKLSKEKKSKLEELLNKEEQKNEEQEGEDYGITGGNIPISTPQETPSINEDDIEAPFWFLQKLRSILKDNSYNRLVGNKLYGDLDFKHLYKISTTNKVFARKEIISKKKYNIILLLDCSGSMADYNYIKMKQMIKAISSLVLEFQKLCNICLIGYNARAILLKDFNCSFKKQDIIKLKEDIKKETSGRTFTGSTCITPALELAIKEFQKVRGQKIIITLTDGAFSDLPNYNRIGYNEGIINETENKGIVILGVGIIQDYIKYHFKNYDIANQAQDIYTSIIKLLDKTIRRLPVRC